VCLKTHVVCECRVMAEQKEAGGGARLRSRNPQVICITPELSGLLLAASGGVMSIAPTTI